MSTLNIREFPEDLFKRMRIRVAHGDAGTIKEFVTQAVKEKLNGKTDPSPAVEETRVAKSEKKERPRDAESGVSVPRGTIELKPRSLGVTTMDQLKPGDVVTVVKQERQLIPGEKCAICKSDVFAQMHPDTRAVRWKCVGSPSHTMSPREKQEKKGV